MASKPLRPCRHPGCFRLSATGWCPDHAPETTRPDKRSNQAKQWHKLYNTKLWTEILRPGQLLREPFCRECAKRGFRVRATDVDHVQPHRGDLALFRDPGNLESLCHSCHSAKTQAEMQKNKRKNSRTARKGSGVRDKLRAHDYPPPPKSCSGWVTDRNGPSVGDFFRFREIEEESTN